LSVARTILLVLFVTFIKWSFFVYRADQRRAAHPIAARHEGPLARADELTGSGHIYLVQMGPHNLPYSIESFAQWLRSKYALDVQVLPATGLDRSSWNPWRRQYVAELLYEQLQREHPDVVADVHTCLIGFTDSDMYSVYSDRSSSFTQRDRQRRVAVISAAHMQDMFWEHFRSNRNIVDGHLQYRLHRILLKDVAILYWHLPQNNDPTSLLHTTLDTDIPAEDIYESDLDPARTEWGRAEDEPCMFFGYSAKDGLRPLPGYPIRTCAEASNIASDETLELFEVDLRLGLLIDKHTDLYLPDTIPIQFQRAIRDGWKGPMGFGISGSHNYDKYLMSDDMRRITILQEDGSRYEMDRVPGWLPVLPLVKYVDAEYSGRLLELRWRPKPFEHFDLKRFDGEVETYLPSDSPSVLSYLIGYSSAQGEKLAFERDDRRRLTRLTSPNKSWLRLSYGAGDRIAEINDSRGRTVNYSYDEHGRLVSVTYPSGEVFYYEYDNTQHLLTFSVAANAKTAPRLLLRNQYEYGRLAKQTLADGGIYTYSYDPTVAEPIGAASVRTPDGRMFDLEVGEWRSTVRERDTLQESRPVQK
jgi:YD repeat-containing protein